MTFLRWLEPRVGRSGGRRSPRRRGAGSLAVLVALSAPAVGAAETDAELKARMLEYLSKLDHAKLEQVAGRLGVEASPDLYECLCPRADGFHYNPGPNGPCKRIGPLGGESWRSFSSDPENWERCLRDHGKPLVDALVSHVRISESLQRPADAPAAPPVAGAALPIDEMASQPKVEYTAHPVFAKLQKLKDMCLPVPGGDAFAPWSESFTRSSITGRHHEVLDELEAVIDGAANPCEAAYSGKLFVDGQAGLYTEEVLAKLAWEFLGPDEWWLGEKVGQGADWAAATPGNVAGKVGWLSIASDVMSGLSLLDEQWHIGRQNQQLLEAKTLFEESRSWTPAQVEASVSSLSTDLAAARKKVDEYRELLSDLRIELFGKYDLARLGPCSELNPIPACQEFARELQQRGAETSYLMRTEAFKAYGLELKRNLQRDVRRKLQRMSCEDFIQERMASCRH